MIAQHLSNSVEHRTPKYVVEAAREVLGEIDLDPASCTEANEVVRALTYYAHDGLTRDWDGRLFVNPPGGSLVLTEKVREQMDATEANELAVQLAGESQRWRTRSRAVAWWRKLTEEYLDGHCREAIFVGFSVDILQASQGYPDEWPDVLKFPICVPEKRIPFVNGGKVGKEPTHGNVIAYLPRMGGERWAEDAAKFEKVFSKIGSVQL